VYGPEVDEQAGKFKDSGHIAYPLILRVYEITDESKTLAVATFGPWQWVPGLTQLQITEGLKLIRAGTTTEIFLSQRDKWLAENKNILEKTE
jgi:hypothetical protein